MLGVIARDWAHAGGAEPGNSLRTWEFTRTGSRPLRTGTDTPETDGGSPLARGNPFGLLEVLGGYAMAVILATLAIGVVGTFSAGHHASGFASEIADFIGEWIAFGGAAVFAAARWRTVHRPGAPRALGVLLGEDYGFVLRPWPDIPLGIAAGVASQYLIAPAFEYILLPFVSHLSERIGGPAHRLTAPAHGTAGLVVLGILLCVGAPLFEELFFRGLLLRGLLGKLSPLGRRAGPALAIVLSAVVFALAHFEALQFLGLFGFGLVLGILAWRTGRLGPGIVAHMSFNAVTVIAIALAR